MSATGANCIVLSTLVSGDRIIPPSSLNSRDQNDSALGAGKPRYICRTFMRDFGIGVCDLDT